MTIHKSGWFAVLLVAIVTVSGGLAPPVARSAARVVINPGDSGPGTLRQALILAGAGDQP